MSDVSLLNISCTGLEVVNYGSKGSGFLSRMFQHATSSSEKTATDQRWLSVSQSKPFPMDGRAPDFVYDTIYSSEMFSELSFAAGIYPSLVISVKCPMNMDCNIRVNVYIESVNLNSGKPIILSACTFSRRDLLGFDDSVGATFSCPMSSEFCVGAKAYVDVLSPMEVVGMHNSISPFAPVRITGISGSESSLYFPPNATDNDDPIAIETNSILAGKKDAKNSASRKTTSQSPNPLAAQYVFYPSDDSADGTRFMPSVQMNEMVFEPKRITEIPVLLFENYADGLKRSLGAWRTRRQLEGMRQCIFNSRQDANANGWHEIRVVVVEAVIDANDAPNRTGVLNLTRPYLIFEPIREFQSSVITENIGIEDQKASILRDVVEEDTSRASHHSLSHASRNSHLVNTRDRKTSSGLMSWASSLARGDVSRPSTYVNMSVHDKNQTFAYDLGRTNTEYHQYNPVYGSNVHSDCVKNPNLEAVAGAGSSIDRCDAQYEFYRYEVKDTHGLNEPLDTSETNALNSGERICVQGSEHVFHRYIPPSEESFLMLDLCLEHVKGSVQNWEYTANSPVLGSACVQLSPNMSKDIWVPIDTSSPQITSGFPYSTGGWLHVEITVNSSTPEGQMKTNYSGLNESAAEAEQEQKIDFVTNIVAPASMPKCTAYVRDFNGTAFLLQEEDHILLSNENRFSQLPLGRPDEVSFLENLISDSYEWQWLCGYSGDDPLCLGNSKTMNESSSFLRPRVDVPYSLAWIDSHIDMLEQFMMEALDVLQNLREIHNGAEGNCFRASCLKKDWQVQPLPTNLHMQMVTLRRINNVVATASSTPTVFSGFNPLAMAKDDGGGGTFDTTRQVMKGLRSDRLIDSLTCGCFTAHGMGHKNGGLDAQQRNLEALKKRLDKAVLTYHDKVLSPFRTLLESAKRDRNKMPGKPMVNGLSPSGPEAALLAAVQAELLPYETALIAVAKRRLVVMSQVLTVAVNALLFKLSLVEEEYIHWSTVDAWEQFGFPLVCESLLSVTGYERSMLEDTMAAVDMLSLFCFKICAAPAPEGATSRATDGLKPHQRIRLTDPNSASIDLRGREVILTLPTATISKCSHVFQSKVCEGQAVIKMVAVLFTQGLDIQQSIENMMGSTTRTQSVAGAQLLSSVELEHFVNSTALEKLNTYCFDVKPFTAADIELRTECAPKQFLSMSGVNVNCHPWIERVAEHVRFTGKAEKNVAMLMEVQRVCHALGGCKVTFCKSGKDRTGMVMSLEQSRILGERFNCGDSEKRVIKDAELMRLHGPRLQVCTKNIGRPLYSINKLQAQFLPVTLRPPRSTMEDMSIFGGNKDST